MQLNGISDGDPPIRVRQATGFHTTIPTKHKTVQAGILDYAEEDGLDPCVAGWGWGPTRVRQVANEACESGRVGTLIDAVCNTLHC